MKSKAANILINLLLAGFFWFGTTTVASAEMVSFTVGQSTHSFDTGNGADGDVEFRLRPGDPNVAEMIVNGVVKSTTTATEIIRKNIMELDGRPLDQRSDKVYRVFCMESITTHLPFNKTYSPSNSVPGSGVMPNFRSLVVGPGVMLKTNNSQPVHFKVQQNLIVEGAILTRHGAAGTSGGQDGESAPGNVIILAGTINVAPNGTTGEHGAILGGWGGGGAGPRWGDPAHGGNGAGVTLYARSLVNRGEIRPGNGGGGSAACYDTWGEGLGSGGQGGNLYIYANTLENHGVIAGSYGGGNGGPGRAYYNSSEIYAAGGYGSGGDNSGYATGGSAGAPSTGNYSCSTSGFGGYAGYWGHGSQHNGRLVISANNTVRWGRLISGYTSGGHSIYWGSRDTEYITVHTNTFNENITQNAFTHQAAYQWEIFVYNQPVTLSSFNKDIHRLHVTSNLTLDGSTSAITSLSTSGNLSLTGNSNVTITSSNVTGDLYVYADATLTGNIGTADAPCSTADIRGNSGVTTIYSSGPVRFKENNNYKTDNWWLNRTVTVNGIRIRGATQSSAPNSTGIIEVGLTDWVSKYNPGGILPVMRFVVERRPEGELAWTPSNPFDRNLSGTVNWQDFKTVVGKSISYRVGFKNPDSSLGYIFIDNIVSSAMSEGGGLDEQLPVIEGFFIGDGLSDTLTAVTRLVGVRIRATDNRTAMMDLKTRIEVNDTPYIWDAASGQFFSASGWGDYTEEMAGLDLGAENGNKTVVLYVRDEAGNVASRTMFARLAVAGSLTPGTASLPDAPAGKYRGEPCVFLSGTRASLNLDFPGAVKIRYAFDSGNYGPWKSYSPSPKITLPKSGGVTSVTIQAIDGSGKLSEEKELLIVLDDEPPRIRSLKTVSGAMATSGDLIDAVMDVDDNISTSFTYSINGGAYDSLPSDRKISLPLSIQGANTITVKVRDEAGNISSASLVVRKM